MTDVIAGRYALIDPIGSGGSGTVWRAFDTKRGAYCAAKLLRQRDAGELLRFVREQSVRLDHPHIVSPYSWAAEDGTVLIASELVGGGSLHTLVGDYGPLAEGTVVTVLRQVLAALAAVHDAELIHRDVKPANVLVRVTGTGPLQVVLTDFGLTISRRDARLTQVGMVIGTPGYLPPEVLLGGVPPDPRHDLYAVGRLALTLLGGDEPAAPTADAIREPILRRAVDVLMRRDPDERPRDAAAAAALLAAAPADREPRTRDGDPVDVLDQLPPLPAEWVGRLAVPSPDGGPSASPAPPGRATVIDVPVLGAPTALDPPPTERGTTPMATAGSASPAVTPTAGTPTAGTPTAGTAAAPRRRTGPLLAAVAGALVLVVGVVLGLRLLSGPGADDPSTQPTTGPDAGSSTAGGTPAPPTTDVQAGETCTWQQEGDRRTGADGVLVCTLADGAYRWRVA